MTDQGPRLQGVVRDGQVQMVDEIGRLSEVPVDELHSALAKGLAPASAAAVKAADIEKERGTFGQQALTLGEAALSTATLGGSDFLGAELSPEWAQATKERREVNPNVTLAGEIVGAVAPALASGGTSLAAKGVQAVGAPIMGLAKLGGLAEHGVVAGAKALGYAGESLAGRAALRGLGGAVAGAVEGGGFEITRGMVQSVLNDTEYTAEKLTSDIKSGVKWGAIGGGVVGVGSTLIGAAGRKAVDSILQGRTLEQAAKDIADGRHVKSVVGDLGALGERSKQIGEKIVAADIPMTGGKAAQEAVEAQASRSADDVAAAAKLLDDAGIKVPDATATKARKLGDTELATALDVPDRKLSDALANRADDPAAHTEYLRKLDMLPPETRKVIDGLGSEFAPVVQLAERGAPVEELAGVVQKVGLPGDPLKIAQSTLDAVAKTRRAGPWESLAKVRNAADDPEALDSMLASVDGVVDKDLLARAANGDPAAQAAIAQVDASKGALGKALEDARDWRRLSKVLAKSDEVKDVTGKVVGAVELLKMLAMGGVGGIPGMAMSAASSMGRKFLQERGSLWLAKMAKGMARADSRVSHAVRGLVGQKSGRIANRTSERVVGEPDWVEPALESFSDKSTGPGAARHAATRLAGYSERYDKLVEQVRTFRDDPKEAAAILEAATGGLAEEHPEVAAAVHQQTLSDAAYIDERLGLGQRLSLNPLSPRAPVTREEKLTALDISDALNDPVLVLEDLASGRYNAEQWAAIEARRPKMYQEFRSQAMQEMLSRYDEIPTQRRIMVGTALKFPADWSMVPENSAALASASPPAEEAGAPPGGTSVNPQSAEMMATPSQTAIEG